MSASDFDALDDLFLGTNIPLPDFDNVVSQALLLNLVVSVIENQNAAPEKPFLTNPKSGSLIPRQHCISVFSNDHRAVPFLSIGPTRVSPPDHSLFPDCSTVRDARFHSVTSNPSEATIKNPSARPSRDNLFVFCCCRSLRPGGCALPRSDTPFVCVSFRFRRSQLTADEAYQVESSPLSIVSAWPGPSL